MAAALNRTDLSAWDTDLLQRYAQDTHSDYCAGCSGICEAAVGKGVPIGDVMRYLMYCRDYGDRDYAVTQFNRIPENIRRQMAGLDYPPAEKRCPKKMAIGRLMREAVTELS